MVIFGCAHLWSFWNENECIFLHISLSEFIIIPTSVSVCCHCSSSLTDSTSALLSFTLLLTMSLCFLQFPFKSDDNYILDQHILFWLLLVRDVWGCFFLEPWVVLVVPSVGPPSISKTPDKGGLNGKALSWLRNSVYWFCPTNQKRRSVKNWKVID